MNKTWLMALAVAGLSILTAGKAAIAQNAAEPIIPNDRMGTATHFYMQHSRPYWNPEKVLPLIADAGFGYIRDEIGWGKTETAKGVYVIPPETLAWITLARQDHLKIIICLNYGNKLYDDPYDPEAYAKFCAEMARQLKGQIAAFEILNEPANFGFSKAYGGTWNGIEKDGSVSAWVPKYVNLINKASAAIKAVDPSVKVIGLGSATPANYRMLALGIAPTVDGIVDHPYSFRFPPELLPFAANEGILKRDGIAVADEHGTFASVIEKYRDEAKKTNGPKELWLTEWGFSMYQPVKPGLYAGYTESAQAKYALRRFVEGFGLGVETSIFYEFLDDGTDPHDVEAHFGLLDHDFHPKKSYEAMKRLTQLTAGLQLDSATKVTVHPAADRPDAYPITWDGTKMAIPGTIPTYCFRDRAGKSLIAIWSAERADGDLSPRLADLEISAEEPVSKIIGYNVFTGESKEIPVTRLDSHVLLKGLTVPDSPLFLELE